MEKISVVQNVGIYLDVRDEKRKHVLADRLRQQMDGFAEYYQSKPEQYRMVVKDLMELEMPDGAVSVSYTHLDVYKRQGLDFKSILGKSLVGRQ